MRQHLKLDQHMHIVKNAQLNWLHRVIMSRGFNTIKITIMNRDNKVKNKSHNISLTNIHANVQPKDKISTFLTFLPSTIRPKNVSSQLRKYTLIFNT